MDRPALTILAVLAATLLLFLQGRWRHDIVALAALLASVLLGLVAPEQSFDGFSHPAIITVAAILVMSRTLQHTGVVDQLAQRLLPTRSGPTVTVAALGALGAVLSGFMNNVGALALLMPVAIQMAQRQGLPAGKLLMPLSFCTILGGTTTLIGTPSNLIVSGFRQESTGHGFNMFDFSPAGLSLTAAGVAFIALIGWRLIPARERAGADSFNTAAYLTEARIAPDSRIAGMRLAEVEEALQDVDAEVVSLVRNDIHLGAPHSSLTLRENDVLLIEADPEALASVLDNLGLVFHEEASLQDEDAAQERESDLVELVILPGSTLLGRNARDVHIRRRFSINLLAISRQGARIQSRVRDTSLRSGDVLLMQGPQELIAEFATTVGCAPLAARALRVPDRKKMIMASTIMILSVGLAAFNIMSAAISFTLGVMLIMATRTLPLRKVYDAVDWPVIVLLAALLPVAQAMETTGAAQLLANFLLGSLARGQPVIALVLIMIATMLMSDVVNNAATAAIMSPVAITSAAQLGVSADPFLIAVAIGASCTFLTPIGHQNNTLILGPGGFRFSDYWRLGLPLDIVAVSVTVPAILWAWPLHA